MRHLTILILTMSVVSMNLGISEEVGKDDGPKEADEFNPEEGGSVLGSDSNIDELEESNHEDGDNLTQNNPTPDAEDESSLDEEKASPNADKQSSSDKEKVHIGSPEESFSSRSKQSAETEESQRPPPINYSLPPLKEFDSNSSSKKTYKMESKLSVSILESQRGSSNTGGKHSANDKLSYQLPDSKNSDSSTNDHLLSAQLSDSQKPLAPQNLTDDTIRQQQPSGDVGDLQSTTVASNDNAAVTITTATIINSKVTADLGQNCREHANLCESNLYRTLMARMCAVTCANADNKCLDRRPDLCVAWNRNGFCASIFYPVATKRAFCSRTCGLCSNATISGSTTVTQSGANTTGTPVTNPSGDATKAPADGSAATEAPTNGAATTEAPAADGAASDGASATETPSRKRRWAVY